jgi:hypothetical protein
VLAGVRLQGQGVARFLVAFAAGTREAMRVLLTGRCASSRLLLV